MFVPRPDRRTLVVALVGVLSGGLVAVAAVQQVDEAASVSEPAVRTAESRGDVAVAFDIGEIDRFVVEASSRAVAEVGGIVAPSRTGSLGMRRITRNGATVHAPPSGYLIPMVYVALPRGAVAGVMGPDVSAVLDVDRVVMNEVTAEVTGAREGDVVVMQAADGRAVPLVIAGIHPYEQIGWGELIITTDLAARLGATVDTRVVMWGFDDRAGLDAALAREGVIGRKDTRVSRSWDPPSPDSTLSTARTKAALGEPWYRFEADGSISMHPAWKAANLTDGRELLDPVIPIRAQCHQEIVDDLRAALADVAAVGLAGEIDVLNANTYGGCYGPRFSRLSGEIGFLSRHAYGMALDTNTTSNCFGCRPRMHCDVVRIFRRHGFAWGGNFRRPDGMHFEWVGERRDDISYPSAYCPNQVDPLAESIDASELGPAVLSVEVEGSVDEHAHAA